MSTGALENVRILVVEDEADARDLIETMLGVEGATVVTASSACEALEQLQASEVDILLSDIGMPEHDGYWLVEQVHKLRPGLPAIALTAFSRREDVERARLAGFHHHVAKPVEPDRLVELLAKVFLESRPVK